MNNLVLKYLENSCTKFKSKTAFMDEDTSITFSQTKHFSLAISDAIINKIGYVNNHAVVVFLPKSVEAIVSMLGIVYSGNFYTPISVNFPSKKITAILDTLVPSLIITNTTHKAKLLDLGVKAEQILCYDLIDFEKETDSFKNSTMTSLDTDLVYTYFTSGSTGVPKGVTINHKNIIDYIDWACLKLPIDETTVFGNQSALYFDITTQDIYATLKQSATMVIIPENLFAFPIKAVEFIKKKNINFLYWVPSAYINIANFKALDKIVLEQVKTIMFGGEVMPVKHLNYLKSKLPNLNFVANVYGPTETTVNATYYVVEKEYSENQSLPLGSTIENKRIYLLDNDNALINEKNEVGEICIVGAGISPGYYKNFEKTQEVFIQNIAHNDYEERMYRSGDLAMYDEEGLLLFCGRKDNQIKHLGYRIELGEIEVAALSLSYIDNCIAYYDERKRNIVLVYTSDIDTCTDRQVKLSLNSILAKYMLPTKYYKLDALPMNNNGKIDRAFLKVQFS